MREKPQVCHGTTEEPEFQSNWYFLSLSLSFFVKSFLGPIWIETVQLSQWCVCNKTCLVQYGFKWSHSFLWSLSILVYLSDMGTNQSFATPGEAWQGTSAAAHWAPRPRPARCDRSGTRTPGSCSWLGRTPGCSGPRCSLAAMGKQWTSQVTWTKGFLKLGMTRCCGSCGWFGFESWVPQLRFQAAWLLRCSEDD